MTNNYKDEFKEIVNDKIKRPGVDKLINYLEQNTDFFEAPASTRYHLCYKGGLVEHSVNVYHNLLKTTEFLKTLNPELEFNDESLAIVSLLHDLCKCNKYEESSRNVKNKETGKWEQVPYYTYREDTFEIGHGAGSMFAIQQFMPLKAIEAQAIFWHMGAFDISQYSSVGNMSKAYEQNKLAFALHQADMISTYITEAQSPE